MQTFGEALKDWRGQRRLSQLDLGLSANVSARHISFLETGRSRPSRDMVLRLCEELSVPRQVRNQMLSSAGLAPAYARRSLSDADMAPVHEAIDWMLERHAPFPAFAVDRHWCVQQMNVPAAMMLGGVGVASGHSLIDALIGNPVMREAIENLEEVVIHSIARLRTESAHLGGDAVLDQAVAALEATMPQASEASGLLPAFVPARYRLGDMRLSLLSTITQFGAAEDIALSELKIEMMFPADEATRQALTAMASTG